MQLADQKQSDRDELEPILYAALINSMVQNFWAIFLGSASTAVAAVMTALKTGDIGPARGRSRFFIHCHRYCACIPDAALRKPDTGPDIRRGEASGTALDWFGALVYGRSHRRSGASSSSFNNDDAVANMLCVSVTVGYTAGGAARNYGQPRGDPVARRPCSAVRCRSLCCCMAGSHLYRARDPARTVLHRVEEHQPQPTYQTSGINPADTSEIYTAMRRN